MSTPLERIKAIQQSYFELIDSFVDSFRQSRPFEFGTREFEQWAFDSCEFAPFQVMTPFGVKAPFEYRLDTLVQNVTNFWDEHGSHFSRAMRESDLYAVLIPMEYRDSTQVCDQIRRLGIYFDTIVLEDPIYTFGQKLSSTSLHSERMHRWALKLSILKFIKIVHELRSLESADLDRPIFVLCPSPSRSSIQIGEVNAKEYIQERFGIDPTLYNFSVSEPRQEVNTSIFSNVQNSDLFLEMLERFDCNWALTYYAKDEHTGRVRVIDPVPVSELGVGISTIAIFEALQGIFGGFERQSGLSLQISADPIIKAADWDPFSWYTEKESAVVQNLFAKSFEEMATAYAITSRDMDFLEAVTLADLRRLREDGIFEDLRETLRLERKAFRGSAPPKFQTQATIFSTRLMDLLDEFEHKIGELQNTQKKRLVRAGASFTASGIVGVASTLFPALSTLAIAGTAAGLLVGGASVRDLIQLRRSGRETQDTMLGSGVAILADVRARHRSQAAALSTASGQGKVRRNDPCPCGSGLKFKRCHG